MAWSYDSSDLDTGTEAGRINVVRLLVGDTNTLDQQVQNEEIVFALSQNGDNVYYAAGWISRTIASQYARKVDVELDGALSAKYSDLAKQYAALSDRLEYQGKKSSAGLGVLAGGITISGVNAARDDDDRIGGSFRRDRFYNPPGYDTPEYE